MPLVVEVTKDVRAAARKATRLKGSLKAMQDGAKVSRRAIENLRDLGRCEEPTLEKIEGYLIEKGFLNSQKEAS